MGDFHGNLLMIQSGLPSVVSNSILCGALDEAMGHDAIEEIIGVVGGFPGLLNAQLIDLAQEKRKTIESLKRTPGCALRTSPITLSTEEATRAARLLNEKHVGLVVAIGGAEMIASLQALTHAVRAVSGEVAVLGIPHSPANELQSTDHCPGYGSAANAVMHATREATAQVLSAPEASALLVLHVRGGQCGWLAAAAALERDGEAPALTQLIYVGERPTTEEKVILDVERARENGPVVVVIGDGGVTFAGGTASGESLARALATRFGIECPWSSPGPREYLSQTAASRTDVEDALALGHKAVSLAMGGHSGYAITLRRDASSPHKHTPATAHLDGFPLDARRLPDEYLNEEGPGVTAAFLEYARPLIGSSLSEFAVLERIPV